jgi:hypothetical protein
VVINYVAFAERSIALTRGWWPNAEFEEQIEVLELSSLRVMLSSDLTGWNVAARSRRGQDRVVELEEVGGLILCVAEVLKPSYMISLGCCLKIGNNECCKCCLIDSQQF